MDTHDNSVSGDDILVELTSVEDKNSGKEKLLVLDIQNLSNERIEILRIRDLSDSGATFLNQYSSIAAIEEEMEQELAAFETIVNDEFVYHDADRTRERAKIIIGYIDEWIGIRFDTVYGFLRYIALFFARPFFYNTILSSLKLKFAIRRLKIESVAHARSTFQSLDKFFPASEADRFVLQSKLNRLEELAERLSDLKRPRIYLAPREKTKIDLLLRVSRPFLYKKTRVVTFDISIKYLSSAEETIHRSYSKVETPPSELALAGIAALCAMLGAWLRISIEPTPAGVDPSALGDQRVFLAALLGVGAFVFLDQFKWMSGLLLTYGWRAAAVIGIVCGLFTNNVTALLSNLLQ